MNLDDTIVAIATPPGRGGIGIVRIAGPAARAIVAPMLRLKHDLEPNRAVFEERIEPSTTHVATIPVGTAAPGRPGERSSSDFLDAGTNPAELCSAGRPGTAVPTQDLTGRIDECVVTYFQKPHSYTTDDIIEISAHGAPVVLRHVVDRKSTRLNS